MNKTVLYIVIPCYNEEDVLPLTGGQFLGKIKNLIEKERVGDESRVLYVDDGSRDGTWRIIEDQARADAHVIGIRQSRNRGHQNAVLAGLMQSLTLGCDAAVSIDCDGQDDIDAIDRMLDAYEDGCEIVYGVREDRHSDTFFKRFTAESYYRFLRFMGADVVFNHADYRLMGKRALEALAQFKEVNLFLRGMAPLIGFKSTAVSYARRERRAGQSHYPLGKMLRLAFDGITSLSVRPIRMITLTGIAISLISLAGIVWSLITAWTGHAVPGWASTACVVFFMGGLQALFMGIIGEYIGKIYLETKGRPRYIIEQRTFDARETDERPVCEVEKR